MFSFLLPLFCYRSVLGPNSSPAQWPNCNRYTEATVEKLMSLFPGDRRIEGRVVTRWTLVLQSFKHIRDVTLKSSAVMEQTDIQLPLLNKKTLQQWYVFLLLILLYLCLFVSVTIIHYLAQSLLCSYILKKYELFSNMLTIFTLKIHL